MPNTHEPNTDHSPVSGTIHLFARARDGANTAQSAHSTSVSRTRVLSISLGNPRPDLNEVQQNQGKVAETEGFEPSIPR